MTLMIQPIPLFSDTNITDTDSSLQTCSICLDNMIETGENIYMVPECSHKFHNTCIIEWLRTGSGTCPVCRGNQSSKTRNCYYFSDKKNILRMVLTYSKRKDAPKKLVKLVKKYEKTRDEAKDVKKKFSIFKKEHKEIFKKRSQLGSKNWVLIRKLRNLKNELSSVPIQPIKRIVNSKK